LCRVYRRKGQTIAALTKFQIGLVVLQLICGGINLLLHAPVWLQLIHLLLADLVWVNLVLFTVEVLAAQKSSESVRVEEPVVAVAS
jgi:heme a synthase